jgi:predicted transcriptional regulator with HTH domain
MKIVQLAFGSVFFCGMVVLQALFLWFLFRPIVVFIRDILTKPFKSTQRKERKNVIVVPQKKEQIICTETKEVSYIDRLKESVNKSPWGLHLTQGDWKKTKYIDPLQWKGKNYVALEDVRSRTSTGKVSVLVKVGLVTEVVKNGFRYGQLTLVDPSGSLQVDVELTSEMEYNFRKRGYYFSMMLDVQEEVFPISYVSI